MSEKEAKHATNNNNLKNGINADSQEVEERTEKGTGSVSRVSST